MLRQVLNRLRNARRKISKRNVARAALRRRLFVESLEDRRLLTVTTTIGSGTAVSDVDRQATFAGFVSGSHSLLNYTEDNLLISVNDNWCCFQGVHYGNGGNDSFVTIATTDGADVSGLEFDFGTGFGNGLMNVVWETLRDGTVTDSGVLTSVSATSGVNSSSVTLGWSDNSQRFDTLRVASSPTITAFGQYQAIALDNVRVQFSVLNQPPTAEANGPYTVNEGAALTMSSAGSSDPDGSISSYAWDYNYDGVSFDVNATGASPSFSAAAIDGPTTRTIALRVTDNQGFTSVIDTALVTISNVNPTATLSNGGAVNEGSPGSVSFSSQFDPSTADSAFRYAYDFDNNGTFDSGNGTYAGSGTSNFATVPAIYFADGPGTRVVRGRIIDKDGGFTDYTTTITINNVAPIANAGVDQTVAEGTSVTLNGLFTDVGLDDGHKQEWSVVASNGQVITGLTIDNLAGDSNGSGGSSFSFTPADNGTYTVNYTVTDDDGGVDSDTAVITVNNVIPQMTISGTTPTDEGDTFVLTLGSVVDPGTDSVSQYIIHWGDGQTTTVNAGDLPADRTVSHVYVEGPTLPTISVDLVDEDSVLQGTVTLDSSFGNSGIVTTDFPASRNDYGYAVAVDPVNGKHVVFANGDSGWQFVRYEADGSLDTSFGVNGRKGFGNAISPGSGNLAIDSLGRLIVGGSSYSGTSHDFAVARYNSDGTLDTTFGIGGKTLIDFSGSGSYEEGRGVTVDSQDRILITGYVSNGSSNYIGVARLDSTGQLDNTFDGDGKVTTDFGNSYELGYSVAVDAITGNVVVFGQTNLGWTFVRYDDSGALDTGFGSGGRVAFGSAVTPSWTGDSLAIDGQGRLLVSGYSYSGTGFDFAVARYNAGGTLDTTFGNSGTAIVDFGSSDDFGYGVAIDAQGRIVLTGYVNNYANGTRVDIGLTRLTTLDAYINVASLDVTVKNVAPVANAGADQTVNEGDLVTLNGSFTDAGVDDGHKQEWSIIASNGQIITGLIIDNLTGDSDGAGGSSFSFTPTDNGTYTVSYKVTDDDGGVQTDTAIVTVNNVIPVITGLSVDSAVIDENGSVTISGSFTDLGTQDTHTVQINWGNGEVSSAALVVQGNGSGTFTATHQYLDDNPTNTLSDAYTISATVTDDDGGVSVSSTLGILVRNVAPVILTLAATSVNENGTVTLSGTYSDVGSQDTHTLTINWGEGIPQIVVVTGGTFNITHQYLDDNPTTSAIDVYTIGVALTDDDNGSISSSTTTTITNVAPVLASLTNSSPDCGYAFMGVNAVTIGASFTDVGLLDTHTVSINWGDGFTTIGSVVQVSGSGSVSGSHIYATGGIFTIIVTLTDDDGGSVTSTTTAVITGVGVVGNTLFVIGTDLDDHVTINQAGSVYRVHANFLATGNFRDIPIAGISRIVVQACGGNDHVTISGGISLPALIDGGTGDDKLNGGNGTNIIIGGDGNDDIKGGNARDILIGGKGSDRLVGNGDEDILIAGWTNYDAFLPSTNHAPLWSLMAEWNRSTDQATRRSNIIAGGGLNGVNRLSGSANPLVRTVHDDNDQDRLTGSSGIDWFFANLSGGAFLDVITDRSAVELLEELT